MAEDSRRVRQRVSVRVQTADWSVQNLYNCWIATESWSILGASASVHFRSVWNRRPPSHAELLLCQARTTNRLSAWIPWSGHLNTCRLLSKESRLDFPDSCEFGIKLASVTVKRRNYFDSDWWNCAFGLQHWNLDAKSEYCSLVWNNRLPRLAKHYEVNGKTC